MVRDQPAEIPLEACLDLLRQRAPRPLSIPEMADMLALERYDRKALKAALEQQVRDRALRQIGKTRYQWIREQDAAPPGGPRPRRAAGRGESERVEGRYCRVRAGYGFVEVLGRAADRFPRDILIPAGMEADALHGDRVAVEVVRRDRRARRVSGRVASVTGRVHERIIGTLEPHRAGWRLMPESAVLPPVDIIGERAPGPADAGLVAVVRMTRPPSPSRNPGGHLEEVLGTADDPEVQFLTIAFEHGLRVGFPPDVVAGAARLPDDPPESDCAGRDDLRALPFVTIDGETAKDFDDAVCLESLPGGGSRLRVAIADVSHYVTPGSAIDAEAAARGTSVYFPDRAIPMLPEQLSNRLCSLNPGRSRLVLVAEMAYARDGQRRDARFYRAVIASRARLTYTQVAAVLSETDTPEIRALRGELGDLVPQLHDMRRLMRQFYRARVRAGSLDLDLPEALIDLSEEGRSVGVRLLQRNDAHRLIEEFMLEANRAVAAFLRERQIPFPYRIHEPPDPADIDDLNEFLRFFGFNVDYDGAVRPQDIQRLLDRLDGHRLARVLSRQVLRSLTQAQYTTHNAGHFGLAFPVYCHFTSPIRRYPDLLVHRQLGRVFDGSADEAAAEAEALEAASVRSSQAERAAMEAERAMVDLKKAEFMLGHLLEPHPGTIVSVTSFGVFVELDAFPVEGLVRFEGMGGERFTYVEEERALRALGSNRRVRLGDRVVVEATNVSLPHRQIDFALLEHLPAAPTGAATGGRPPRPERRGRQRRPRTPAKGKKRGNAAGTPGARKGGAGRRGTRR